jgi:hypothetical protein
MAEGYGVGMWCTTELRTGRRARGRTVVINALLRRTITPRGTLRGGEQEAAYGLDLAGFVGAVGATLAARALPLQLRNEWLKDDRVQDVSIAGRVIAGTDGTAEVELDCQVLLQGETESFPLTLRVSDVTVTLLGAP